MMKAGRGVVDLVERRIKLKRESLPAIHEILKGIAKVWVRDFDGLMLGYCIIRVNGQGNYELSNDDDRGLKCFLNQRSMHMLYQSDPSLKLVGGITKITTGIRVLGHSTSRKSVKGELL